MERIPYLQSGHFVGLGLPPVHVLFQPLGLREGLSQHRLHLLLLLQPLLVGLPQLKQARLLLLQLRAVTSFSVGETGSGGLLIYWTLWR